MVNGATQVSAPPSLASIRESEQRIQRQKAQEQRVQSIKQQAIVQAEGKLKGLRSRTSDILSQISDETQRKNIQKEVREGQAQTLLERGKISGLISKKLFSKLTPNQQRDIVGVKKGTSQSVINTRLKRFQSTGSFKASSGTSAGVTTTRRSSLTSFRKGTLAKTTAFTQLAREAAEARALPTVTGDQISSGQGVALSSQAVQSFENPDLLASLTQTQSDLSVSQFEDIRGQSLLRPDQAREIETQLRIADIESSQKGREDALKKQKRDIAREGDLTFDDRGVLEKATTGFLSGAKRTFGGGEVDFLNRDLGGAGSGGTRVGVQTRAEQAGEFVGIIGTIGGFRGGATAIPKAASIVSRTKVGSLLTRTATSTAKAGAGGVVAQQSVEFLAPRVAPGLTLTKEERQIVGTDAFQASLGAGFALASEQAGRVGPNAGFFEKAVGQGKSFLAELPFGTLGQKDVFQTGFKAELRSRGFSADDILQQSQLARKQVITSGAGQLAGLVGAGAIIESIGRTTVKSALTKSSFTQAGVIKKETKDQVSKIFDGEDLVLSAQKAASKFGSVRQLQTRTGRKTRVFTELASLGFAEGVTEGVTSQLGRRQELTGQRILLGGAFGAATAGIIGTPIALRKKVSGPVATTVGNVLDPSEFPGDVIATVAQKTGKKGAVKEAFLSFQDRNELFLESAVRLPPFIAEETVVGTVKAAKAGARRAAFEAKSIGGLPSFITGEVVEGTKSLGRKTATVSKDLLGKTSDSLAGFGQRAKLQGKSFAGLPGFVKGEAIEGITEVGRRAKFQGQVALKLPKQLGLEATELGRDVSFQAQSLVRLPGVEARDLGGRAAFQLKTAKALGQQSLETTSFQAKTVFGLPTQFGQELSQFGKAIPGAGKKAASAPGKLFDEILAKGVSVSEGTVRVAKGAKTKVGSAIDKTRASINNQFEIGKDFSDAPGAGLTIPTFAQSTARPTGIAQSLSQAARGRGKRASGLFDTATSDFGSFTGRFNDFSTTGTLTPDVPRIKPSVPKRGLVKTPSIGQASVSGLVVGSTLNDFSSQSSLLSNFLSGTQTPVDALSEAPTDVIAQIEAPAQVSTLTEAPAEVITDVSTNVGVSTQTFVPVATQTNTIVTTPVFTPVPRIKKKKIPASKQGHNAFVREKGKFLKANKKPVSLVNAQRLGRDIVENSSAASFKTFKTDMLAGKPQADIKMVPKTRFRLGKSDKKLNVEKRSFRINTPGEKRGITAKGLIAKRRKSFKKKAAAKKKRKTTRKKSSKSEIIGL